MSQHLRVLRERLRHRAPVRHRRLYAPDLAPAGPVEPGWPTCGSPGPSGWTRSDRNGARRPPTVPPGRRASEPPDTPRPKPTSQIQEDMKDLMNELNAAKTSGRYGNAPSGRGPRRHADPPLPRRRRRRLGCAHRSRTNLALAPPGHRRLRLGGTIARRQRRRRDPRCEPPPHLQVTWCWATLWGPAIRRSSSVLEADPTTAAPRLVLERLRRRTARVLGPFGPGAVGIGWDMPCSASGCISPTRRWADPPVLVSEPGCAIQTTGSEAWGEASPPGIDPEPSPASSPPPPSSTCRPPRDRRRVAAREGAAARAGPGRPRAPRSAVRARG